MNGKDSRLRIDPKKVAELMFNTNCTARQATTALQLRKNIMEFALEYIQRRDLNRDMSPEERYPAWAQYLRERKRIS